MESLEKIYDVLEEIAKESGRLKKEEIIKSALENEEIKQMFTDVVLYAYDSLSIYNCTKLNKYNHSEISSVESAFSKLFELAYMSGCKHSDVDELTIYCSVDEKTYDVFNRVVGKDLRCGVNIKTWKKYIPTLYLHEVMLCDDDFNYFKKKFKDCTNLIYWSEKLDGVRCWAIVPEDAEVGDVKYLSRNGKTFRNFSTFDETFIELAKNYRSTYPGIVGNIIFDGEVISKDKKFDNLMTQIQRHDEIDSEIFRFYVFDIVLKKISLYDRYKELETIFKDCKKEDILLLKHNVCSDLSLEDLEKLCDNICNAGGEGIVIKDVNSSYETKRSKTWCKMKKTYTLDLPVIDHEYGEGRNSKRLGALFVDFKGTRVKVGSGYSDAQREEYVKNIPKLIEVRFQEITKDGSLRFPVFLRVREDKD